MSARRPAPCALAGVLLATLGAGACVDEVVVGTQRSPISALDGGHDASWPEPDAGEPDAHPPPEPDAGTDAELPPPKDAGDGDASPSDAAADDGPIVIFFDPEAGRDGGSGAPALAPCFACDGTVSIVMTDPRADAPCEEGLEPVCWENTDDTCSVQCPPTVSCGERDDCAPDEYCYFPRSDCGTTSRGWCAPRPRGDCTGVGNQVCGCDGNSYANGCRALQAGVAIAGPGYEDSCPLMLGS